MSMETSRDVQNVSESKVTQEPQKETCTIAIACETCVELETLLPTVNLLGGFVDWVDNTAYFPLDLPVGYVFEGVA